MRKIAVVGAGQAGLLAAHALNRRGYEVTLYSDKSPDDFLERARPTGAAGRFESAIAFERELDLEHWGSEAPRCNGVHLTFSTERGNQLLTLLGRLKVGHLMAIDLRMQSATWMNELIERGGKVEIEDVSVRRLDEISARNDLTIVAAGRGDIMKLFPRDDARSRYRTPQRFLAMVCFNGVEMGAAYAPWFSPIKFNFFASYGEMFWMPWYSKDRKPSIVAVFEARPGSPIDRFRDCRSAEDVLKRGREVVRDLTPWDYEKFEKGEVCDENSWLIGGFTPEVRKVVGTLPSGRNVMALGDTAHSLDPIGGQGANNGNKMTQVYVDSIVQRGTLGFDATWMAATFDRFWSRHRFGDLLNNTLLEPLPPAGRRLLMAQYGSTGRPDDESPQQRLADTFFENFNNPVLLTEAFHDEGKAKKVIRDIFGSTSRPFAKGAFGVAKGQLRQKVGMRACHPGT
jgi:2-polyprenyl-6-methoxyphenol hydroxylase-like FAD-dependent oxidoreductase